MTIHHQSTREGIPCLKLEGSLTSETRSRFLDQVRTCVGRGENQVHLDLSEVGALDLAGIGSLLSVLRELRERGGALRILSVSAAARKVLELVHLRWFLDQTR